MASDRHIITDRAAAEVASSVIQDIEIIRKSDSFNVIHRTKVRQERIRKSVELKTCQKQNALLGLFFDEQKDKIKIIRKEGRYAMEEHLSLISEAGSAYLGKVTPKGGPPECLNRALVS